MTGGLTTKGIEGAMQKGIILTTNDPFHPSVIANLAIRFPINGQGLRVKAASTPARLRDETLWAHVVLENCEPDKPITIEALELPEGWSCQQTLPLTVSAEDRFTLVLTLKVEANAEIQAFDGLTFTLLTDSVKTPRVQGTMVYRPEVKANAVSVAAGAPGAGAPPVRWPMTKLPPLVAPVTAPVTPPQAVPSAAPAVVPVP
jgi:hypothetical protein